MEFFGTGTLLLGVGPADEERAGNDGNPGRLGKAGTLSCATEIVGVFEALAFADADTDGGTFPEVLGVTFRVGDTDDEAPAAFEVADVEGDVVVPGGGAEEDAAGVTTAELLGWL